MEETIWRNPHPSVPAETVARSERRAGRTVAALTIGLPSVDLAQIEPEDDGARGGDVEALARGLVGTRFMGQLSALAERGEKE